MRDDTHSGVGLRRAIAGRGFSAFGAVAGSGWVVVVGEWLR
ncbi:hypothetical protein [Steroidobacter agaridevorans]|nr:hypothetical protein [Steroidobacter agaridevorans]